MLQETGDYYPVWKGFQMGKYRLCVSNEILEEYQEMIERKTSQIVAKNVIDLLFDVLKDIPFPKLLVIRLKEFLKILMTVDKI